VGKKERINAHKENGEDKRQKEMKQKADQKGRKDRRYRYKRNGNIKEKEKRGVK
jgi:hypothetical protein